MKLTKTAPILIATLLFAVSCNQGNLGSGKVELKNSIDSMSYAIGVSIAKNITKDSIQANPQIMFAAMNEIMNGNEPIMNEMECQTAIQTYMMAKQEKMQEAAMKAGQENLEKGKAFLEKVKTEEGVVAHESGVLYKVMKEGEGEPIGEDDPLKVHYHGTTIDGSVFDSSVDRNEPFATSLNQVIPGWKVLSGMKVGTKCKLYIPSELAYGPRAAGEKIGPNSVLIFEVEILEKTETPVN